MQGLAFFDTNVLVYTDDSNTPEKRSVAIDTLRRHYGPGTAVLSVQVLQEYYYTVTRKLGSSPVSAQKKVEHLSFARVVTPNAQDVIAAIELHRLQQISFWDALIVHAARIGGAEILYSEDFQHGSVLGGVRVVNPFLGLKPPPRRKR